MKRAFVLPIVLSCLLAQSAVLFAAMTKPNAKSEVVAQQAAEEWLALVDAKNYAESWRTAASHFKKNVSEKKWNETIAPVREPLGKLVSRKLKSAQYTKELPGAPDGEYVVIQFDTVFENKKAAVETVTPMKEKDGSWRVSTYRIN